MSHLLLEMLKNGSQPNVCEYSLAPVQDGEGGGSGGTDTAAVGSAPASDVIRPLSAAACAQWCLTGWLSGSLCPRLPLPTAACRSSTDPDYSPLMGYQMKMDNGA